VRTVSGEAILVGQSWDVWSNHDGDKDTVQCLCQHSKPTLHQVPWWPASICRLHCSPSHSIFPTTEVILLDGEKNQNQNQLTRDILTIPSSINIPNTGWGTQAEAPQLHCCHIIKELSYLCVVLPLLPPFDFDLSSLG